jgi:chemotaxis family two-component system response regulator Rcp1
LPTHGRPIRVLVVESNPADAYLTLEALKQTAPAEYVIAMEDGRSALQYLRREGGFIGVPIPDVIFLDLNLTPVSGFDVLGEIRATPDLAAIPIVILSGSQNGADVRKAYQMGANCYITNPATWTSFFDRLRLATSFGGRLQLSRRSLAAPSAPRKPVGHALACPFAAQVRWSIAHWEREKERGPLLLFRLDPNPAAMRLNCFFAEGETESVSRILPPV